MEVYEPIELPRLSPALTPAQRLHLELHGYVVVEDAITNDEVVRLRELVYELEARLRSGETLPPPAKLHSGGTLWFRLDNLPHLDPAFLEHVTHPRLWGMAEEAIGGEARLEQSDVSIHRPGPAGEQEHFGLHGSHYGRQAWVSGNGLYHFPFVKTLTLLTDVGPDDGGTVFLPGSHRLSEAALRDVLAVAVRSPELLHHVEGRAGSTALFYESTIHGGGHIRSGNDRMYIVSGYTPPMFQPWHEYDPDPEWLATLPPAHRVFLSGSNRWLWGPRPRTLTDEVQTLEAAQAEATERAVKAREAGEKLAAQQRDIGRIR